MSGSELSLAILRFPVGDYAIHHGAEDVGRGEVRLVCPRCSKDNLALNLLTSRWQCFTCVVKVGSDVVEGGGGLFALVKLLENLTPRETARYIIATTAPPAESDGDVLPDPALRRQALVAHAPQALPTGLPENCLAVDGTLPYLARRGISLSDVRDFGLGYCRDGWVADRLVFPVWERGACIYWQARAMWDEVEHDPALGKFRKTLNPARHRNGRTYFGSRDVLLNLEQAARYPRVAITEGPTSCIRVGRDAVATFGKQLHPAQIKRLVDAGVHAVDFMWDGPSPKEPEGARRNMLAAAANLSAFLDVRIVFLPEGDPGDYSRAELSDFRRRAQPYNTVGDTL